MHHFLFFCLYIPRGYDDHLDPYLYAGNYRPRASLGADEIRLNPDQSQIFSDFHFDIFVDTIANTHLQLPLVLPPELELLQAK